MIFGLYKEEPKFKDFAMTFGSFGSIQDQIQISIKNSTDVPQNVDILSRVQPAGISVSANTMPMSGVITRLQVNPMKFTSMKVMASNPAQLDNPILLVYKDNMGSMAQSQVMPAMYKSSFQTQSNMVEITGIEGILTVDSTIETTVNAMTTLTLILKVQQLFNNRKDFDNYMNFMNYRKGFRNFMHKVSRNGAS
jgi:hypothetical protein